MPFRIDAPIFDDHGEWDDDIYYAYHDGLIDQFSTSPEGEPIIETIGDVPWTSRMIYYGASYLGESPATMSANDLQEIIFEIFPRKISCEPDAAAEVIDELRAFWQFAQREHASPNAAACLAVLDDDAVEELAEELSDPANFGMAKSFVMMGQQSGYDMSTEEGLNAFMMAYNASIQSGSQQGGTPGSNFAPGFGESKPAETGSQTAHTSSTGPMRNRKKQLAKAKRAAKKAKARQRNKKAK